MKLLLAPLAVLALTSAAPAAVILFDLQGKAGFGLLAGNENGTVTGAFGSGGEIGAGISYDNVSNILTINVAWGSANGFTNLSTTASAGHIHGPTGASGTAAFTQDAGVLFGLDSGAGWNPNATNGGINKTVTLTEPQEAELLAGRYYVNIHTAPINGGGEIRGNMVVVPEPSTALLAGCGLSALALRRRRA